jgi:hypothetical protein
MRSWEDPEKNSHGRDIEKSPELQAIQPEGKPKAVAKTNRFFQRLIMHLHSKLLHRRDR